MGSATLLVYSALAFRTPRLKPLRVFPRPNPLLTETCFVLGLVDMVTFHGVFPLRVLILTTPLPMSPYSTDGTPVMTSTDSILDDAMLFVDAPLTEPERPLRSELVNDALFDRRTPSTSIAVPNDELPLSPLAERRLICWSLTREGFTLAPPGRRLEMSLMFIIWTCSRAVLSMVLDVAAELEFSCAVTTALSRVRLSSSTLKVISVVSPENFTSWVRVT